MANYTGQQKLAFCQRLHKSWRELATLCDIQSKDVDAFQTGEEASEIWDWLKTRNRLGELPEALRYIDREDLVVDILEPVTLAVTETCWQGSPFPGLRAFTEQDAPIFFGRERETQELLDKLRQARFVAVIGASGSGKSSLVAAGLLPRLMKLSAENLWDYVRFTPGELSDDPFLALAAPLANKYPRLGLKGREIADKLRAQGDLAGLLSNNQLFTSELLLFIDQFEELFTLCDESHHHRFIELLARVISSAGIQAVLTLRADFYHRCIDYPRLAELLRSGSFPLAAPDLLALNEMILGPAAVAGLHFEDGLASRILTDTGQEPGSLPLLAFALEALYQARTDNTLTHTAYEQIGGVQGVIRQRADAVFKELTQALGEETAEQALRQVFIELVEVDPERGTPTRKRAPLTHFEPTSAASKLIDRFAHARLLVCSGDDRADAIVEVAHEALLTQWPKLSNWIEECFEDLRIVRQAQFDSQEWERLGKPDSHFWRDERIRSANSVIQRLQLRVSAPLKAFLCTEAEREIERFLRSWPDQLNQPDTDHQTRAKIGDRLAELGDPRPGVGLNTQGLPDIVWLPVPSGTVTLEDSGSIFRVEPFYIAKYPVTWVQYRVFLDAKDGYRDKRWWQNLKQLNPSDHLNRMNNYPAEVVSWFDAIAFCRWLSDKLGYELRLPTEWEWQQAATGGEGREYPWGDEWQSELTNTAESRLDRTTAVGLYPGGASPIGALDMVGNVWEWCLNQYSKPSIITINDSDAARVLRGGSWLSLQDFARAATRYFYGPGNRLDDVGFRLCRPSPID